MALMGIRAEWRVSLGFSYFCLHSLSFNGVGYAGKANDADVLEFWLKLNHLRPWLPHCLRVCPITSHVTYLYLISPTRLRGAVLYVYRDTWIIPFRKLLQDVIFPSNMYPEERRVTWSAQAVDGQGSLTNWVTHVAHSPSLFHLFFFQMKQYVTLLGSKLDLYKPQDVIPYLDGSYFLFSSCLSQVLTVVCEE